ncbi:hemopexin repeat-containing protein [Nonomuraea angiospora]|uniref:hemopexin repeat-containing protein n=1 Tax=Nonomuraea angiospora TaxID=46172 RepID=UPI0034022CA4
MRNDASLPSYQRLFGHLDLRAGDEARSVHSPAAYLTDLLTFLQETFHDVSLLRRRPGIGKVKLDADNTFTALPYLDIVNEVLEALVGEQPYERMKTFTHPRNLPFSLEAAKFSTYLKYLGVDPVEFSLMFAARVDPDRVTRDYLGLTEKDVDVISVARPDAASLADAYGLRDEPLSALYGIDRFLAAASLTGEELRELLYQDTEDARARSGFWVHQGAVVEVSEDERSLVLRTGGSPPNEWFDRAHRFVRLARRAGLSFTELDRVAAGISNELSPPALRAVAAAAHLNRTHDVPFDLIAALIGRTLPDEIKDGPFPAGDILAPRNLTYRRSLARSIDLAETGIAEVVRRLRARYAGPLEESPFDRGIGRPGLVVLNRVAKLTGALDLSVEELFTILDVLEADPAIERRSTFPVLPVLDGRPDVHVLLERDEDPAGSLWLAQTLFEVVAWMRTWGLSGEDLAAVLGEPAASGSEEEQAQVIEGIAEGFAGVMLTAEALVSDRFDERAARVLHETLTARTDGVVSPYDARLLRIDPGAVTAAAHDAVGRLALLGKGDFTGLGLGDRLAGKIFNNLVIRGAVQADGLLAREDLPAGFALAGDFSAYREALFGIIAGLEGAFYPSDLATALPLLSEAERTELYDNLVHNGYLSDGGEVLDPEVFADPRQAAGFRVNAPLGDVAPAVPGLLGKKVEAYKAAPVTLDPAVFGDLNLTAERLAALMESLRFNGVVDAAGVYRDKDALAALGVDDLGLALEFHPVRRAVLEGMQAQVAAVRYEMLLIGPADFAEPADDAMATRVMVRLEGVVTDHGRVFEDVRDSFDDAEGTFDLGEGFTDEDGALVFDRIAGVIREQAPYRLDLAALGDLGFTDAECTRLVAMLVEAGDLAQTLAVPAARLPYFLTVSSALDFVLPGLEDYAKDVFFLLHAVAKEQAEAARELTETLGGLAARQHDVLPALFQDVFGVPGPVVEAIDAAVTPAALDVLVAPALAGGTAGPDFRRVYRRLRSFARLAAKFGLDADEVTVAFRDQDLVGKFPEPLALPPGHDRFDALLTGHDGLIYVFHGDVYWTYSAKTLALTGSPKALSELSPRFTSLTAIDAAFTLPGGAEWIIGRGPNQVSLSFTREPGATRWAPKEQVWGKVRNNFAAPKRIDGAYVDSEGRTHLFAGDQYLRYSGDDFAYADEGFPRPVTEWWQGDTPLPESFHDAIDAVFHGHDGRTYVLSGERAFDGTAEQPLAERFGLLRNAFDGAERLDAAYADADGYLLFRGDQVVRYTDSPENDGVRVAEGYPRRIETWRDGVPVEFESGVEAAFEDGSGTLHLFKDGKTVALGESGGGVVPTVQRWGLLADVLPGGRVDAAFAGLDGRTYLFSGERYIRYSGADYTVVDSGYPRAITGDWGGLDRVDAAFVMDGAAHLFGPVGLILDLPAAFATGLADGTVPPSLRRRLQEHGVIVGPDAPVEGGSPEWRVRADGGILLTIRLAAERVRVYGDDTPFYVRYSTRDYTTPDEGFPKPLAGNWLNLPDSFTAIDSVFTGHDGQTYLFSGDRFVVFDNRHRWWSEPKSLVADWDSMPFGGVDAAFAGRDGKTYVFWRDQYARFSGAGYTELDDRYPAATASYWGNVVNTIQRTGRVDATLVMDVTAKEDGTDVTHTFTYLFSGGQYVRYRDHDYRAIEDGYPRALSALAKEPRMGALQVALDGVDAAFADRRTVYLFRGGEWHAVSDGLYRSYELPGLTATYVDQGSIMAQAAGGWRRQHALEGPESHEPVRPPTLRTVPEGYRDGLDAVLTGADGNTYLFKGPMCFDTAVRKDYRLDEEWGRPRNTIYQDNTVDAAFVGRDGRTYLFSGDQFVVYGDSPDVIDGEPMPIAEHWGGLTSVALAYYRDGTTYLFERPDANGMMRHVVYTGDEGAYVRADAGYPALTDETFWKAPDGFPMPDAVLFEGQTMVLLAGERCVQLSEATGLWSHPRPIERLWRGFRVATGDRLKTAFTAADGMTHFFFTETYASYAGTAFTAPLPIRERWGRSVNAFGSAVDAAVVFGGHTYLFHDGRYVRYSGRDYRYIDPGYPKPIVGELRREAAFAGLPESFDDLAAAHGVTSAVANGRTACLFTGDVVHAVSLARAAAYPLGLLGRVRNTITDRGKVDAALVRGEHTFLFSGDQYVRYTGADYRYVDEGYPRTIEDDWGGLPPEFEDGVDAAFIKDGRVYFFKGDRFTVDGAADLFTSRFGRVRNAFADTPVIDAAFAGRQGELYAFAGDQYVRYAPGRLDHVEQGYPRTIKDDWGALPHSFEARLTGAFTLGEAVYLAKDDQYVRYSGPLDAVDRTFPQQFRRRWSEAADYRLTDVHTIVAFADLCRRHPGLAGLLATGAADPYERLCALFSWDLEELRWVKRNAGLITEFPAEEDRFEIEFLLKLARLFTVAARTGAGPSALYGATADTLAALLPEAAVPLAHGDLNVLKRDALVSAVLHVLPDLAEAAEIYEHALIDVEMGREGATSRVREAIAATQLYLHRYLLDLEEFPFGQEVKSRLRTWWQWLKTYRVWEANRKVFLYPENYVRPELRDTKTPAFRKLEEDLLQGEITADSVRGAYMRYLDEYTEVSRLAIAGAYVYRADGDPDGTRQLVLFGRTRTDPRRWYLRQAEFRDGQRLSASWGPWEQVEVQIDADRVDPVHAFGRVFAFWTVVEAVAPEDTGKTVITARTDGDQQSVSAPPPKHRVRILYSFQNLNRAWVAPQALPPGPLHEGAISGETLSVQASATVPGAGTHDSIVVSCAYKAEGADKTVSYALTPELYPVEIDTPIQPAKLIELDKVFAEQVGGVVRFNMPARTPDGPWFSVDHKGGSFLVRPVIADPGGDPPVLELKGQNGGNGNRLPVWDAIDAAFERGDTRYFFNNAANQFLVTKQVGPLKTTPDTTSERWGNVLGGELAKSGKVDAVLVRGASTFVFCGREYYRYHGALADGTMDLGYPKRLDTNQEGLPQWTSIDAAFTWDGAEYFVSGDSYAQRDLLTGQFVSSGRMRDKFVLPDRVRVKSGLVKGSRLLLIFGDTYMRYVRNEPEDKVVRDLKDNPDSLPPKFRVAADVNGTPYFFGDETFTVGTESTQRQTRLLGKIATTLNTTGVVGDAYVQDDYLFLTSGQELYRYSIKGDEIPLLADPGYPKALPRAIGATFRRDAQRYVFSGEEYTVIPARQEPTKLGAFSPIEGSWLSMPPDFATAYTGIMETASELFLFLGGRYAVYPKTATVLRPYEFSALPHEVVRLTSSTAFELNRRLLVGGVPALLAPETQEIDELPAFSTERTDSTTIQVTTDVAGVPVSTHLDFQSANGRYYWEIFFHAPLLIAQALNAAQRFADAKTWYEYVFDPTEPVRYWRFLPFLAVDLRALVAACRTDLANLAPAVGEALGLVLDDVESLAPLFEHARACTPADLDLLDGLPARVRPFEEIDRLREKMGMIAGLRRQYDLLGDHDALLKAYRDDPFDPHAIAELRPSAYRRAVVMAYVDNVLDWGDLLFRQYTAESLDEARMLYILAFDLLGRRPQAVGARHLSAAKTFEEIGTAEPADPYAETLTGGGTLLDGMGAIHRSVGNGYFFIPGNTLLGDYWDRVEDRLRKLRASLDIMGVSRPLPLFEPPADVMALVRGAAAGLAPDQITAGLSAAVPHYRFSSLFRRAQDLVERLRGFGGDLQAAFDRRDSEELTLLQNRQEARIRQLTRAVREAQVESAAEALAQVEAARDAAAARQKYYEDLIANGLTALQQSQIKAMTDGVNSHFTSAGLKIGAAIAYAAPQVLAGPFILGTEIGGEQVGKVLDVGAEIAETLGEAFSVLGELYGVRVDQERQEGDWNTSLTQAKADQRELGHQIAASKAQLAGARRDLEIADQEIADQEAVVTFLTGKFTGLELYRWQAGRLAGMYFTLYGMAHELAKAAERAYQYERGVSESYIQPVYWESRRAGLLAGEALSVDLERLGGAYTASDERGLEITKRISLLQLDPMAVLALKNDGRCEFALSEELYDRDFPGHYRRCVKTVSVVFSGPEGPIDVNAVLTQTGHKTVLEADAKAVRYLLDGKGEAPASVRSDWRPSQRIALSDTEEGRDNNGLFELRFDDERYLPFEGTGAVSTWRMEITGRRPYDLFDVVVTVKYTAEQGGDVFANAVRGMRRPYAAARYVDVAGEFPEQWQAFLDGGDLVLPIAPEMFPDMVSTQISGLYARYDLADGGSARLRLNGQLIDDRTAVRVPGLRTGEWRLTADGEREALIDVGLVLSYRAG